MIMDAQNLFSEAQNPTTGGAVISTNVLDLSIGRNLGGQEPLFLFIQIATAVSYATSLRIQFVTAATTTITSSPVIHWDSNVVVAADYDITGLDTAGNYFLLPLPTGQTMFQTVATGTQTGGAYLRYMGMIYTPAGAGASGITAALVRSGDLHKYAASGYVVA